MNANRVWISSPRRTAPRMLERTFVGDAELADRLVDHVVQSSSTPNKHYNVLAGARGAGKSHLLALVCGRVRKQFGEDDLAIAWLDEPSALASELHFFISILVALGVENARLDEFSELGREAATSAARAHVEVLLAGRTLMLCVEQLDDVLAVLGDAGQRGLRSFFQQERACTVLATVTELTQDFTDQGRPFFGFFGVHRLDEMDAAAAIKLLAALARARGDSDSASAVKSPEHRPALRALHHMLGGLPSRYVDLLREAAEVREPERLLLRALDDHERRLRGAHARLSPQQRLILHWLSGRQGAAPVKNIARACFISEQTVSPQLRELRAAKLVISTRVGRESWHEVRDPLTGIDCDYALELFGFLREWYADRNRALEGRSTVAARVRRMLKHADDDPRQLLRLPAHERALAAKI